MFSVPQAHATACGGQDAGGVGSPVLSQEKTPFAQDSTPPSPGVQSMMVFLHLTSLFTLSRESVCSTV